MGLKFAGGPEPGRNRMARAEANGHRVDVSKAKLVGAEGAEERFKAAVAKTKRADQIVQGLVQIWTTAVDIRGGVKVPSGPDSKDLTTTSPNAAIPLDALKWEAMSLLPAAVDARAGAFVELAGLQLEQIKGALAALAPDFPGAPSDEGAGPSSPKADEGGAPVVSS